MSSWRRRALELLPEQRGCIQSANSPRTLWQHLTTSAIEGCRRSALRDEFLRKLFQYARESCRGPSPDIRASVYAEFYERLFEDELVRPHLLRYLQETEFLELEPALSRRWGSRELAAIRAQFYSALRESQRGTTLAAAREVKDELLGSMAPEAADVVRGARLMSLPLLEVHEDVIALEMFIDTVSCLEPPISSGFESRLADLLRMVRGRTRAGTPGGTG